MNKITLKRIVPNNYYATLLQDTFASQNSETKNILQFLYFSYVLSSFENDFGLEFYSIAQDEIFHHKLLGELIVQLGGNPKYFSSKGMAFSGGFIDEIKGIRQIIETSIELKEKSIINYKILVAKIAEKDIKNILEIIISDEKKHLDLLKNMLKKYQNN